MFIAPHSVHQFSCTSNGKQVMHYAIYYAVLLVTECLPLLAVVQYVYVIHQVVQCLVLLLVLLYKMVYHDV
jgi:hypothetical protein